MLQQATHQKDTIRTNKETLAKTLWHHFFMPTEHVRLENLFTPFFKLFNTWLMACSLTIILMDSMFEILQNDQLRWGFIILHESYTKIHTYSVYM